MKKQGLSLQEAIELFRDQYRRFEKIEGRPWGVEGAIIEMMKQVGDLSKYVMVAEKYYPPDFDHLKSPRELGYTTVKDAIGDELADIFSMIIRIADHYEIDFEQAHIIARKGEDKYLNSKNV